MLLVLSLLDIAAAQAPAGSGFDAHGFRLAAHDADVRDPLVGWRPGRMIRHDVHASLLFEYASRPLVFDTGEGRVDALDELLAANASFGYAPHERFRLDVAVPVHLYGQGATETFGLGLGDIRTTALVNVVAPEDGGFGLGMLGNVDIPTGDPEKYRGQTALSGGIGVAFTVEEGAWTLSGSASSQLRPNTDPDERPAPTQGGDAFAWAGSIGFMPGERTGLTLEIHGESPSDPDVRDALGTPVESLLSMKHARKSGAFLTTGLGIGLTRGAGASPLRLIVGGGFGTGGRSAPDLDGDGFPDESDSCPGSAETLNDFKDEDGCPDELPRMTVRAIGPDGTVSETAELTVTGPGADAVATGSLTVADVRPGGQWTLSAVDGACLQGSAEIESTSNSQNIDIPLVPVRPNFIDVEVVGPEEQPVPSVSVALRSADAGCAPNLPVELEQGAGSIAVGAGSFFAFVSAPAFDTQQKVVVVPEAGRQTLRVQLVATLAEVVKGQDGKRVIQINDRVYFDTGTARIQERSKPLLAAVAKVILDAKLPGVRIGGHTDSQGSASTNLALSARRASAVRDALVALGVPVESLTAEGFGEEVPLADNDTDEGRARNRRVEFDVLDAPTE